MKAVIGFPKYEVSSDGRVYSLRSRKFLNPTKDGSGYYAVKLYNKDGNKTFKVHRIVAFAYPEICGEYFEGAEVDHIDGNKHNNRADNLRWVTHNDNIHNPNTIEKVIEQAAITGRKNGTPFKAIQATSIPVICLSTGKRYKSVTDAARDIGVSPILVSRVCRGLNKRTKGLKFSYENSWN